jgi:hypothetical protein
MRRLLYVLGSLLVGTAFIASCTIDTSDNGDLDGMWQMMEVQYAGHNGNYDSIVQTKDKKIYWSVQYKLMDIIGNVGGDGLTNETLARFDHAGDSLVLYDFYRHYRSADSLISDSQTHVLNGIGVDGNVARFFVEKLTSDNLLLRSTYARVILRKF